MIRCFIVDDEPHAISLLQQHVRRMPELELAGATTQPEEAISRVHAEKIPLLFLDMEMPKLSGFDVIRALPPQTRVILCTGHRDYAAESYRYRVIDYLLKPVAYAQFVESVRKALALLEPETEHGDSDFIFIPAESRTGKIKINLADITLIEAADKYAVIHCGKKKWLTLSSLKQLQAQLPPRQFVRVHHSYIVPVTQIAFIDTAQLRLAHNAQVLPLGAAYKQNVYTLLRIPVK